MRTLSRGYGSGWIAEFRDERALMEATRVLLESGLSRWDVFAPYPCESARLASMRTGVGRRRAIRVAGVAGGIAGACLVAAWLYLTQDALSDALVNQGRMQGLDWWFGYVPAVFVGLLLGAGLMLALAFLITSGLPMWFDWVEAGGIMADRSTSEGYFIVADSSCGDRAERLLNELNPVRIEWVAVGETDMKGDVA